MSTTVVQDIVDPCAQPTCPNRATKQVYVTWPGRYLTRFACDEHVAAAEAALLAFVPQGA